MSPEMHAAALPAPVQQMLDRLLAPVLDAAAAHDAAAMLRKMSNILSPDGLSVDLDANYAMRGGVKVRVAPSEAVLLHRLLAAPNGERTSRGELARALHGASTPIDYKMLGCVGVMVCGLRKKLGVLRADVVAGGRRGYRVELQPLTP